MVGTDVEYCKKIEKNIKKTLFWSNEDSYSMEVCIVVFVWKLDIFSFHCYIDHFINQERSKDITNWNWPGQVIFALSKMKLNSQETLLHILCLNLVLLVVTTRPRPFLKEEWWRSSMLLFFLRVSFIKTGCSQVKNFI